MDRQLLSAEHNSQAKLRLVCLPYAGGSTAIFHRFQPFVPPEIELLPLRLPGREDRVGEPVYSDLLALAEAATNAVIDIGDRPIALLGHSLGAYVALEIARDLRKRNERPPILLAFSAAAAPPLQRKGMPISHLGDQEFVDEMARRYDGIPPAFRNDPQLLELLIPPLRADVRMWEHYQPTIEAPLNVEIMAMGGADDPRVSLHDLQRWRNHTTGRFSTRLFPGGHFFLFRSQKSDSGTIASQSSGMQTLIGRLQNLLDNA